MAYPDKTDKELARIERQLRSIYTDCIKELNEIIDRYENGWNEPVLDSAGDPVLDDFGNPKIAHHKGLYERYNEQYAAYLDGQYKPAFDQMTDAEMKATWWYKKWKNGTLTDEEMFEHWWLSQQGREEYWVKLRDEMAERLTHTNEIASDYINGKLPHVYTMNYNDLTGLAQKASSAAGVAGMRFNMIDDRTLQAIIMQGDRILPYAMTHIDPKKDTPWNRQKLQGALYQGIIAGDDVQDIAKRFMAVEKMNESSAIRNARTAVTNARCAGFQNAMEELDKQGCETSKYWDDVHDSVPPERQWHWDAGIQYSKANPIPYRQMFIVNGETLMYPGDSMHGASGCNLYNCRCRMGTAGFVFRSVLSPEKRKQANIRVTVDDTVDGFVIKYKGKTWAL